MKASSCCFTQLSKTFILSVIKKQILKQLTFTVLLILTNQIADNMSSHAHSITSSIVRSCFKFKSESTAAAHMQQQSQLTFKVMKNSQSSFDSTSASSDQASIDSFIKLLKN